MQSLSQPSGVVFNIQRYSVHDGPGIRTLVFLKGCPLRCRWCSNPESHLPEPELAFNAIRCLGLDACGRCRDICPRGALTEDANGQPVLRRNLCGDCPRPCAAACPSKALLVYGKRMTVDEVIAQVEQDAVFYQRYGGGMTLSGGEPLSQPDFALALLEEARQRRLATTLETSGLTSWETLERAVSLLTTLIYDIKHMDPARHQEGVLQDNALILANFRNVVETFPDKPILVRTPVIPGYSDDAESLRAIIDVIRPYRQVNYELLPYHRLGTQKYAFLDKVYPMGDVSLANDTLHALQDMAAAELGDRLVRSAPSRPSQATTTN